jgi:hypothetical protein
MTTCRLSFFQYSVVRTGKYLHMHLKIGTCGTCIIFTDDNKNSGYFTLILKNRTLLFQLSNTCYLTVTYSERTTNIKYGGRSVDNRRGIFNLTKIGTRDEN